MDAIRLFFVLVFVGAKMMLVEACQVPILAPLGVIARILGVSIVASRVSRLLQSRCSGRVRIQFAPSPTLRVRCGAHGRRQTRTRALRPAPDQSY